MQIVAISGSLRSASYNTALLRGLQQVAPAGVELVCLSLAEVPLFNEDLEAASGLPAGVLALRQSIQAADALIVSTPEYNSGIPGVLKNTFDWLSRTDAQNPSVLMDKPMALVSASPGSFGGAIAQASVLPMLRALGLRLWAGQRLALPLVDTLFDAQGAVTDAALSAQLQAYMQGFSAYVREQQG